MDVPYGTRINAVCSSKEQYSAACRYEQNIPYAIPLEDGRVLTNDNRPILFPENEWGCYHCWDEGEFGVLRFERTIMPSVMPALILDQPEIFTKICGGSDTDIGEYVTYTLTSGYYSGFDFLGRDEAKTISDAVNIASGKVFAEPDGWAWRP